MWQYARDFGYLIVTKDADFGELSLVLGFPPQVIWIRRGNCGTAEIVNMLREKAALIEEFSQDPGSAVMELF